MAWETVIYEKIGTVARVTLNRPETHNAQNARMLLDLDEALKQAAGDPESRVIILRGAGKSFSSGHDMLPSPQDSLQQEFSQRHRSSVEERLDVEEEYFYQKCLAIRNLRKPTIASVHGNVVLAGAMLACMCDIIIAAESTRIWYPSLRQTGTGAEVMVLPFEVGFRKAKEYLWTGDPIPIREAERSGMVNRVVADSQLEAETLRLAERIALTPPVAARLVKRSLNHMQNLMGMTAGLDYHFLIHQIGHATSESTAWFAEARRRTKEMGFEKGFLEFRDGPYEEQAKQE